MPFGIHPHQLRHSCGFMYANMGKDTRSLQAFLGHRNINSTVTVRYTAMSPDRFRGTRQRVAFGPRRRAAMASAIARSEVGARAGVALLTPTIARKLLVPPNDQP